LSEKNLFLITDLTNAQDFSFDKNYQNVDQIWNNHNTKLLDCINLVAPLKKFKERPQEIAPWEDEELLEKLRARDYFYSKNRNANSSLDPEYHLKYKQYKTKCQSLEREKMKDYFRSKKITDFKSNKLYWKFQSTFIKIKSSKTDDFTPNTFLHGELEYEDPVEISNLFNTFFTNLSSTSLSSEKDCDEYIDKTFARLKSENKIRLKTMDSTIQPWTR
jgi:hypothetical protein